LPLFQRLPLESKSNQIAILCLSRGDGCQHHRYPDRRHLLDHFQAISPKGKKQTPPSLTVGLLSRTSQNRGVSVEQGTLKGGPVSRWIKYGQIEAGNQSTGKEIPNCVGVCDAQSAKQVRGYPIPCASMQVQSSLKPLFPSCPPCFIHRTSSASPMLRFFAPECAAL
jgi:hypothetical protein